MLVALYTATDGPRWANSDNWLSDAPIGEWYGVTTRRRAAALHERCAWPDNDLNARIPDALGTLTSAESVAALRAIN